MEVFQAISGHRDSRRAGGSAPFTVYARAATQRLTKNHGCACPKESGHRHPDSRQSIDKGLDKAYEHKSLKENAEAPVSALSGLALW